MSAKQKTPKNKIKSKRGAQKRFKFTASGKVRFRSANRAHMNTKRSTKQERHARVNGVMSPQDAKLVVKMMRNDL